MHEVEEPSFPTHNARQAFTQLIQAFTKALILQHFDSKQQIQIETNVFSYAIGSVLSQITSKISQWHSVVYYSQKIILAETRCKTHNAKLLAIFKAFKNWQCYLKSYPFEVVVLIDHKNLCRFIDTKRLSSCLIRCAQELSCYNFHINYC